MSWNDERVELLKKLWIDGMSASQIASSLGDVTRNAVIGKIHRLGLSNRARPGQVGAGAPAVAAAEAAPQPAAQPVAMTAAVAAAVSQPAASPAISPAMAATPVAAVAVAPAPVIQSRPKGKVQPPAEQPARTAASAQRPVHSAAIGNAALKVEPVYLSDSVPVAVPAPSRSNVVVLDDQRVTIMMLTEQSCRWPIGDPGSEGFSFCGKRSETGIPYCAHHARIAYQPVERRRDRRPGH
ncbi:GcrA family cell cycle regulator [Pseudoxanthobacter sp.]|uniref:GcrA family cell cycle regulator n=1 Tax=Pseudoxanthobacter sp. TaxID=1925742 RepID=UPI002FE137F9